MVIIIIIIITNETTQQTHHYHHDNIFRGKNKHLKNEFVLSFGMFSLSLINDKLFTLSPSLSSFFLSLPSLIYSFMSILSHLSVHYESIDLDVCIESKEREKGGIRQTICFDKLRFHER